MAALDFPNAPTNGQQYSAPNGVIYTYDGVAWTTSGVLSTGSAAGGDLQGTYPNPTIKPTSLPWTPSGGTLTPTDATKTVSVPGGAASAGTASVILGSNTAKGRIQTNNAAAPPYLALSTNREAVTNVQDDATKPSWQLALNSSADNCVVARQAAGAGSATALLTLDNVGKLLVPGATAAATDQATLLLGSRTMKGRVQCLPSIDWYGLVYNGSYNGSAWAQDDNTKASWSLNFSGDAVLLTRWPPGPAASTNVVTIDNLGNLVITGTVGQKASGTTWANPSDPRLKQDVASYEKGLAEILGLEPITYRLKAQPDGPLCYGFDAEQVRDVFPECVTETSMKLDPADEEETPGVLTFDMHPILVALVNAVKELTARVAALEAHA